MQFQLPSIRLPNIQFQIGEYPSTQTKEHFGHLTSESGEMIQSMGNDSQRENEILKNLQKSRDLIGEVQSSRDIRVVIQLWRMLDAFIAEFPVSQEILTQFQTIRRQQGSLALFFLTQLFLERFDDCGDSQALSLFLRREFSSHASFKNEALEKLRKQAPAILTLKGPEKVVSFTIKNNRNLDAVMQMVGIPEGQSGKYLDVCKQYYYIETLKSLEPGDESNIFDELVKDAVVKMPYHDKWLGHEVLNIMIQKGIDSGDVLPENWLQIILNIADDPRVSMRSEWWSLISHQHIEAMQGWLAGFDLDLFLKALKNYAKSSYDDSLKRMFPARARFLQGLFDHKLITLSKLFIGREPARYIKSLYDKEEMPKFSKLTDSDLSIIYLKVGNIHMVEGSHSFSLRLYDELPDREKILNYSRSFRGSELGPRLAEQYERKSLRRAFSVTHNPNLTWQHKVIQEFNKQGISVNPEWVLTPSDYKTYRQKFPMSIRKQSIGKKAASPSSLGRHEKKAAPPLTQDNYERILEEVRLRPNKTALEIARAVNLEKSVVNSVLYIYQGNRVEMDDANRWRILE